MQPLGSAAPYTKYAGNGSSADGWPSQFSWLELGPLWFLNQHALIDPLCDNSPQETANLYTAITTVATATGVDPRFILAIIMEESHGCVRVGTTSMAVSNPGLMQSYEGKGTCVGVKPCPLDEIVQMVKDGTARNAAGVDLQDLIADASKRRGVDDADGAKFYIAARMYNSGKLSIGPGGDLSIGGANAW